RLASAAKVSASGNDSRHRTNQATIDAGPAVSAATAGRTRIPVPSTAPVYRATAVGRPIVRSSSTFIDASGLICPRPRRRGPMLPGSTSYTWWVVGLGFFASGEAAAPEISSLPNSPVLESPGPGLHRRG